jgi:uncharacterized protein DUF3592
VPRWFAWLLCALGAVIAVAGLRTYRLGRESRSYTRTRGHVVRAEVEHEARTSEEGGSQFRPRIRYAFEAHGRTFESDRVSVSGAETPATTNEAEARRFVERYPSGAEVDVWFDPSDPRRSVLVRGAATAPLVAALAIGLALAGAGLFALAR